MEQDSHSKNFGMKFTIIFFRFCIVVPIDSDPAKLTELTRALENSGFPTKRILLGGPGLRIE